MMLKIFTFTKIFTFKNIYKIMITVFTELCGKGAFPQIFYTRKLGKITVFFAVSLLTHFVPCSNSFHCSPIFCQQMFPRTGKHCIKYSNFTNILKVEISQKHIVSAEFRATRHILSAQFRETVRFHKFSTPGNQVKFQYFAR